MRPGDLIKREGLWLTQIILLVSVSESDDESEEESIALKLRPSHGSLELTRLIGWEVDWCSVLVSAWELI